MTDKQTERRSSYPMSETEMYQLKQLQQHINDERRQDEKQRLLVVKEQKRIWKTIFLSCCALNIGLLICAWIGYTGQ